MLPEYQCIAASAYARSSGNKRPFQKLFGGSLHHEIEACAIVWDVFSSAVNLEEDFTQQSIVRIVGNY